MMHHSSRPAAIPAPIRAAALGVLVCLLPACGAEAPGGANDPDAAATAPGREVNFYNWSNYIDERVLTTFTAETGIRVNYDYLTSNDELESKLVTGNSGYDLVVPTGHFFAAQQAAGYYQPLDRSRLPNYGNLDSELMALLARQDDPGNAYAIPYAWGTNGLAINDQAVAERLPNAPTDSWDLIFDPANAERLADCGIAIVDAGDELAEIALNYLGYSPQSTDVGELREAMAMIARIRPFVRYFDSGQYIDDLANGEICVALGWSGDIYQAIADAREGVAVRYVIPREGTILWFDLLAMPKDAPNVDEAYALIDFLLRPETAAALTNFTFYPSGNVAAEPLVDPAIRANAAVYPGPEVRERLFLHGHQAPSYVRIRNRLWTAVKAGRPFPPP